MLKRKSSITEPVFKRLLKTNHIQSSVFAFKTKIELTKIQQALESKNPVPKIYIDKLEEIFNVRSLKKHPENNYSTFLYFRFNPAH